LCYYITIKTIIVGYSLGVKCDLEEIRIRESKERCVMIRIGFDPILEAEQQHKDMIKEIDQLRLVKEGLIESQTRMHSGSWILALIGKEMASLGASLEARYGGYPDRQDNLNAPSNPGDCTP
jgi:hypothetical protein